MRVGLLIQVHVGDRSWWARLLGQCLLWLFRADRCVALPFVLRRIKICRGCPKWCFLSIDVERWMPREKPAHSLGAAKESHDPLVLTPA